MHTNSGALNNSTVNCAQPGLHRTASRASKAVPLFGFSIRSASRRCDFPSNFLRPFWGLIDRARFFGLPVNNKHLKRCFSFASLTFLAVHTNNSQYFSGFRWSRPGWSIQKWSLKWLFSSTVWFYSVCCTKPAFCACVLANKQTRFLSVAFPWALSVQF